jgi:hypothetical protein
MKTCKYPIVVAVLVSLPVLLAPGVARADGSGKAGQHEPAKEHKIFTGRFDVVDVANSSVTLSNKEGGTRTVSVNADTRIEVNGKPAGLADIKVGMYGGAKLQGDSNTALMLRAGDAGGNAQHVVFNGRFTAVDVEHSTVTLANKEGATKTVTTNAQTQIQVNGKAGTLSDIQIGMMGAVKLAGDGTTVLMLRAHLPK